MGLLWLVAPVFFLVLGYVVVALACLVYNVIGGKVGGIGFTLEPDLSGQEPPSVVREG